MRKAILDNRMKTFQSKREICTSNGVDASGAQHIKLKKGHNSAKNEISQKMRKMV